MKKKQLLKRPKLIYEQLLQQAQKEDVAFFSSCPKFGGELDKDHFQNRALQFLWLKEKVKIQQCKKVNREDALKFIKRRVCKIDSTQMHNGPPSARLMPTSKVRNGMIRGWHNGACDQKFDLGKAFQCELTTSRNDNEEMFQQFLNHERRFPNEIDSKMKNVLEYNRSISETCKLTGISRKDLSDRLQQIREANRQKAENVVEYIDYHGQRMFQIVDFIKRDIKTKKENRNVLQKQKTFQLTPFTHQLKIRELDAGEPLDAITTNTARSYSQSELSKKIFYRKRNSMGDTPSEWNTMKTTREQSVKQFF